MAARKKFKDTWKRPWNSTGESGDTYAAITYSMITSPAFIDLDNADRVLLIFCHSQYYKQCKKPRIEDDIGSNDRYFYMNRGLVVKTGLCAASNTHWLTKHMRVLIEHGFIDCVLDGSTYRKKSIYAYSTRWIDYGTDNFTMPISKKTNAMRRRDK